MAVLTAKEVMTFVCDDHLPWQLRYPGPLAIHGAYVRDDNIVNGQSGQIGWQPLFESVVYGKAFARFPTCAGVGVTDSIVIDGC